MPLAAMTKEIGEIIGSIIDEVLGVDVDKDGIGKENS